MRNTIRSALRAAAMLCGFGCDSRHVAFKNGKSSETDVLTVSGNPTDTASTTYRSFLEESLGRRRQRRDVEATGIETAVLTETFAYLGFKSGSHGNIFFV